MKKIYIPLSVSEIVDLEETLLTIKDNTKDKTTKKSLSRVIEELPICVDTSEEAIQCIALAFLESVQALEFIFDEKLEYGELSEKFKLILSKC